MIHCQKSVPNKILWCKNWECPYICTRKHTSFPKNVATVIIEVFMIKTSCKQGKCLKKIRKPKETNNRKKNKQELGVIAGLVTEE